MKVNPAINASSKDELKVENKRLAQVEVKDRLPRRALIVENKYNNELSILESSKG